MGKQFPSLDASHRDFISKQRIFFAASAAAGARVNVSPRGTDAFAVIDERTVAYLDRTGSGNETAAHLKADGRLTIMFCAFEGPPNIMRLYGRGEALRRGSRPYAELLESAFRGVEPAGAPDRPPSRRNGADVMRLWNAVVRLLRRATVARQLVALEGRRGPRGATAGEEPRQHRRPADRAARRSLTIHHRFRVALAWKAGRVSSPARHGRARCERTYGPCSTFPAPRPRARTTPPSGARSSSSPPATATSRRSRRSPGMSASRPPTSSTCSSAGPG